MGFLSKFRKDKKRSLEQEVADNLAAILNTKESFGAWQKGLGMRSDFSGKTPSDIIEKIVADMTYNIEHFEKRVKLIEIEVMESKNISKLRFQIKCQLGSRFHSYYIGFNPIEVEVDSCN